jgi:hypothetical protein
MPSVKTHFIEVRLSPEDGTRSNKYDQLNTPRGKLSFDISAGHELTVRFFDEKARTVKFNLLNYYKHKLENIQDLRKNINGPSIGFVYDAVSDFPVKITVKFLKYSDFRNAIKCMEDARIKAESAGFD